MSSYPARYPEAWRGGELLITGGESTQPMIPRSHRTGRANGLPDASESALDSVCGFANIGIHTSYMKTKSLIRIGLLAGALTLCNLHAGTWPGFRGPTGVGIAWHEENLPVKWSANEGVRWRLALPGRGNSSPVVTKDRIYLTSQTKDKALWVIAIEKATGELLWKRQAGAGALAARGPENLWAHRHNPATSTPVASERRVFAFFGNGAFVCFDKEGEKIWERDLVEDYGEYDITFGMGSSPRFWKGKIYQPCMTKGPSYVVALDSEDGKTLWRKNRRLPAEDDGPDAYSTPAIWRDKDDNAQLVVAGSDHVDAYNLETGEQIWVSAGLKINSPYGRVIASPAVSRETIVQCSGNPGGGGLGLAIALRGGGRGDVTESNRRWEFKQKSADGSTPVIYEGKVFWVRENGVGNCLNVRTGEVLWEERLARGPYFASVVAGDGKIYFLSVEGVCTVVKAGENFEKLSDNRLEGKFYATPAVSDGVLYLRSEDTLYAIAK